MTFETKSVEELTATLIDYRGKTPPKCEQGVRLITAKVIKGGFIQDGKQEYISEETYEWWMSRGYPHQWDILITTEAPLGEVAQLRENERVALAQRVILLRGNPKEICQQYYFQAIKSPIVQSGLQQRATGTTVLGIKQSELRQVRIPSPPLPTQRKIASILSAYDDLIENNLRRIKILEEMAQTLYREWFVKFRLPGHEKVRMVDSPLGKIPEGWEISTLGEHLESLESGKRPKGGIKDLYSGVPSVGAENVIGIGKHNYQSEKLVPQEFFESMNKGVVQNRDVALYKDGAYIGRSSFFRDGFPHVEFCVNEHVFLLRTCGKKITQNILYLWLQEPSTVATIRSTNANAAQPGINQKGVKGIQVLLPPEETSSGFDQIVEPYIALIINLAKRNQTLSSTRDLLLPKLISGDLDVSEVDITVPKEAA